MNGDAPGGQPSYVTILVDLNDAPTPEADAATVAEDGALLIPVATLLGNDTDPDGGAFEVTAVGEPVNGVVSVLDGVVTFTPTPGHSGPASFDYTVADGFGGNATATVAVSVTATANLPPSVGAITAPETNEDAVPVKIDLLAGASDPEGGPLSVAGVTAASSNAGRTVTVAVSAGGVLTLDPEQFGDLAQGASETVTINYTISDGVNPPVANTATIVVEGRDEAPSGAVFSLTAAKLTYPGTAGADTYVVDALTDSTHALLDRILDFDPAQGDRIDLSALGLNASAFTIRALDAGKPTEFTRITAPGGFELRVNETLATVTPGLIFAQSAPQPPVAVNDAATTAFGAPVAIAVLGNDSDPNGDALRIASFDPVSAQGGTVTLDDRGTTATGDDRLIYTPLAGFFGADSFDYAVADGGGLTDGGAVTVVVASAPPSGAVFSLTAAKLTYPGTAGADTYVVDALTDSTHALLDRILDFDPAQGDRIDLSALGLDASAFTIRALNAGAPTEFTRITGPGGFELRVNEALDVVTPGIVYEDLLA